MAGRCTRVAEMQYSQELRMRQTLRTNPHSSSNIPRHVTLAENWGKPLECWARRTRCVSGSPAPTIRWGLRFLETPARQSRLVHYVRRPAFDAVAPDRRVAGDEHLVRTRAHMQNAKTRRFTCRSAIESGDHADAMRAMQREPSFGARLIGCAPSRPVRQIRESPRHVRAKSDPESCCAT